MEQLIDKAANKREKVLHVDDNINFLELFKTIFTEWFDIESVSSCNEALEKMDKEKFDAIIIDYDMPEMNGMELFRRIRVNHPDIPVIFFTGHGSEEVARKAFVEGISDYIIKGLDGFLNKARLVNSIKQAIEKKKAEIALRESETRYRFLYDESQAINVLMALDGTIVDVNRACLNLMECTKEELIGRSAFDCVLQEQREEVIASFMSDVRGEHSSSMLMDVVSFNNNLRKVLFGEGAVMVRDEKNEPVSVLVNAIDITDQFLTEEALDAIKKELLTKNREITDFTFRASQYLKKKLLHIKDCLEGMKNYPADADESYKEAMKYSDELLIFVDRLQILSSAGNISAGIREINPEDLIRTSFSSLSQDAAMLKINSPLPRIFGDNEKLSLVFNNLMKNSFQFSDPQKKELVVEICGERRDDAILICCKDNGLGIDKRYINRIFDIGFAYGNAAGSGFGLSIARRVIETHGGEIWAKSPGENMGSEFFIKLPQKV